LMSSARATARTGASRVPRRSFAGMGRS
jgi:hypothetical protein